MCNCKDCPGDDNAPSKWECRACYGVKYLSDDERREEFFEKKRVEALLSACGEMARAITEIERAMRGKIDREALYRAIAVNGDYEPGYRLCGVLERRVWKTPPELKEKEEELL